MGRSNQEEPFSGETIFEPVIKDEKKINLLIETSQKNWAIVYVKKVKKIKKVEQKMEDNTSSISVLS